MSGGFKDLQNRAMDIAMENAESTLAFAAKISNAKTSQDILALQTRYAQDRMQAFVTQTQKLVSLIEETGEIEKRRPGRRPERDILRPRLRRDWLRGRAR